MKTIQELSNDIFYGMENYSQLVIDFVEEVEDILDIGETLTEDDFRELGSIRYNISTVLDIYNPVLLEDIEVLKNLDYIISEILE